jgi:predicted Rossmann fold flavoprotein
VAGQTHTAINTPEPPVSAGRTVAIAGGGASGFFAAIACAETAPGSTVVVFEKSPQALAKVRISGGGRCNVTHACFDPRALAGFYPRGGGALIGAFHRFQPRDTHAWFEARGVRLKTEPDGRMFPVTDSSQTIVDCLLETAKKCGVRLVLNTGIEAVTRDERNAFMLRLANSETFRCDRLMLATGGCRVVAMGQMAASLGHTLAPPAPSLFSLKLDAPWLTRLAGVSLQAVEVSLPESSLKQRGALLITHEGLSGPAVLRLSAWAARELHDCDYRSTVRLNLLPEASHEKLLAGMNAQAIRSPARRIANTPLCGVPSRLWEALLARAGVQSDTRWAELSSAHSHTFTRLLFNCELPVIGKSLNKDEFVTCGGVSLKEVDFKTMQSRICPGLYFGGELLDMDGLTGGFNFQAAWTTGWIAGRAMAAA